MFTLYIGQKEKIIVVEKPVAIKVQIIDHIPATKTEPVVKHASKPNVDQSKPAIKPKAIPPQKTMSEDEIDKESTASILSYKDLFPGPTWPRGSVNVGSSNRTPTKVSSETKKISGHLEGQLDIPLVFRENTSTSKAVAKFRRSSDGRWMFEYIDGEPVLRAVVFQAFKNKTNLDKISELSEELETNEIIFVLEQVTKPAINGMKQFEDRMSFSGSRIIYTRMIFSGHDGSSGIPIPDAEAERAKLRDRVALKRLMDSPAYHSPIRNRHID